MAEQGHENAATGAPEAIRRAIADAGGTIPFVEFQRLALYGPGGFYIRHDEEWAGGRPAGMAGRRTGGRAGRRTGDFLTSPEVGPLFGAVLARYLDDQWRALGEPSPFVVVDAGAGPGTLARSVLAARPLCREALHYVAVEVSPAQRADHPAGVESRPDLPAGPFVGVIIANELLDNLPVRLLVFDGSWREAFVIANNDGTFAEVLSDALDPVPVALPTSPPHGARAPLHDEAVAWVAAARGRLRTGRVLVFDYARSTTASIVGRPWREWLRTYRHHERGGHYLRDPGSLDITVELALDQFPEPDAVRTQAQFLWRWGIDALVAEGDHYWAANAATPDVTALAMRSRAVEAGALVDSAGLGAHLAVEWAA